MKIVNKAYYFATELQRLDVEEGVARIAALRAVKARSIGGAFIL